MAFLGMLKVESKDVFQFEKRLDLWWQNLEFNYKVPPPDRAQRPTHRMSEDTTPPGSWT